MGRLLSGTVLTGLAGAVLIGGAVFASLDDAPTPADQAIAKLRADESKQRIVLERHLCRKMAACSKYDRVRLECATAGNVDTCLRIKMGDDFSFVDLCGVDYEGGPAALLDPRTPNALRCFFLNASR